MSGLLAQTLDLSQRRELDWLGRVLADLRSAAPTIEPLLVGALARDLLLHYGHGLAIERATRDVDLALAVSNWDEFFAARDALLASGLFTPYRNATHKLQHARHGWIDLIPFGAVEAADGSIAWPPAGDEVMAVIGYAEAATASITVALPHGLSTRMVSLPMLIVLKLLAWKDRHAYTGGKDAADLGLMLRRYLEAGNLKRLYSDFPHLITDRFDFEPAGGWMLGRDARAALLAHSARFDQVMQRLEGILAAELSPERESTLAPQLNSVQPDRGLVLLWNSPGSPDTTLSPHESVRTPWG